MGLILTSTRREKMENKTISITNRFYETENQFHKLPKIYDNQKWIEDKDWLDGRYKMVDRIYGGLFGVRLIQKDGTEYKGSIKYKKFSGKAYSFTEDGRWFNGSGFPVEAPSEADTKAEISNLKSEIQKREEDKKFQALKNKITNNLKGDR